MIASEFVDFWKGLHVDKYRDPMDDHLMDLYLEFKLFRLPPEIRPALEARLRVQGNYIVAWLQAICASFPERKLIDVVREGDPRLFPPFLCTKEASESLWGHLVLTDNDVVSMRDRWSRQHRWSREKKPIATWLAELEAFRACRFQQGFASEGMLCDEPPIPLRVLDFLETQDLVNLSLVCKSAHQAAHLLFKREEKLAASSFPKQYAKDECRPYLLRETRLASLMHGSPEAIPDGAVGRQFLRQSPADPKSPRSATWGYIWGRWSSQRLNKALYYTLRDAMDTSGLKLSEPGDILSYEMSVLEAPQLLALRTKLVQLQAEHVDLGKGKECDVVMMQNLISVVNGALEMKEAILLRYNQVWASDWD